MNLVKKIFYQFPGVLVPSALTLATTYVATRYINSSVYGVFSLLLSLVFFIKIIFFSWIQQSAARTLPSLKENEINAELDHISKCIVIAVGLLLIFICIFHLVYRTTIFDVSPFVLFFLVLSVSLNDLIQALLFASFKEEKVLLIKILRACFIFIFRMILLFFIFKRSSNSLVIGMIIGNLLVLPIGWRALGVGLDFKKPIKINKVKKYLIYGIPMSGWLLSSTVLVMGDRFVLQFLTDSTVVGIYSANYNLINSSIFLLTTPINLIFTPQILKYGDKKDTANLGFLLKKVLEALSILGCILIIGVGLFKSQISLILGSEFREGASIFVFVITGLLYSILGIYTHKIQEIKYNSLLIFVICIVTAILNILLNFLLIPIMGYIGAAYSTLFSYLFYTFFFAVYNRKILDLKILSFFKIFGLPLTIGMIFFAIDENVSSVALFGVDFFIKVVIYVLFVFVMIVFFGSKYMKKRDDFRG